MLTAPTPSPITTQPHPSLDRPICVVLIDRAGRATVFPEEGANPAVVLHGLRCALRQKQAEYDQRRAG